MPDTSVVQQAANEAGWIAGAFATLVLAGFALLGWLIRQLWLWLRELQTFSQTTMLKAIRDSTECMRQNSQVTVELVAILTRKPCLLESEESMKRLSMTIRQLMDKDDKLNDRSAE